MSSQIGNVRGLSLVFGYHWNSEQMVDKVVVQPTAMLTRVGSMVGTLVRPTMGSIDEKVSKLNFAKIASYIPVISLISVCLLSKVRTSSSVVCLKNFTPCAKTMLYTRLIVCTIGAGAIFLLVDLIATILKGVRHCRSDMKKTAFQS